MRKERSKAKQNVWIHAPIIQFNFIRVFVRFFLRFIVFLFFSRSLTGATTSKALSPYTAKERHKQVALTCGARGRSRARKRRRQWREGAESREKKRERACVRARARPDQNILRARAVRERDGAPAGCGSRSHTRPRSPRTQAPAQVCARSFGLNAGPVKRSNCATETGNMNIPNGKRRASK